MSKHDLFLLECWNEDVVPGEECYSNGLWSNFKLVRADRAEVALLLFAIHVVL